MNIGRNNYENYIIEYIEGIMNLEDSESMRGFLSQNPDIADEIEGLKDIRIIARDNPELNKTYFYKDFRFIAEINDKNFEEFCIAFFEGDLDDTSKALLINYIGEEIEKEKTFKAYQSLILKSDNNIRFKSKNRLKKHTIPIYRKYAFYAASIAAAVILAIVLKLNYYQQDVINITSKNTLAHKDKADIISLNKSSNDIKYQKENIKKTKSNYQEIAAVDTNRQSKDDYLLLVSITPMEAKISGISKENQNMILSNELLSKNDILKHSETDKVITLPNQAQKQTNQGNNLLIRALKLGIKGISDLTESNIALSTQTDDEGNLTAFAISAGEFGISRKMNSKLQKN
jgi:hypothetical protein